jgi:signal transduction histidine kinase
VLGIASVRLAETLRSSTFRLALIAIGLFGAIVLTLFGYVYLSTTSYLRARLDNAVIAEQLALQKTYDREGRAGLIAHIDQRTADEIYQDSVYLLTDSSYRFVAGNLKTWPSDLIDTEAWQNFRAPTWKVEPAQRAMLRIVLMTFPNGDHLLLGKNANDLDAYTANIKTAFMLGIALICILATMAGVLVTRRTVGRIEAINATSRAIMQSGLDTRIPLRGTNDEWDQVAENLNSMLDRIEALVEEVKQVTDNVAHDLRTPLTRIRGRLEKALHRGRDNEADQELIADTIANLDGVLRIFSSLTRIAQIESNAQKVIFREVDITEITGETVELYDAAAEENGTHLNFVSSQRVCVIGDRDLIFDAVANLVDNAIKHGRPAGNVAVRVAENSEGAAVISVIDDGPGIPAAEQQNVFKRFYRLERSRHTAGNGLGLSLVAAVARLHNANVELLAGSPGLQVRLVFPTNLNPSSPKEEGETNYTGEQPKHRSTSRAVKLNYLSESKLFVN